MTATGESDLDLTVRGPLARPEIYGQMELKQASLNLRGVPNGIEGANGKIFLSRDRATIENLTARTGGGTLRLDGWVGFGGERPAYGLRAMAKQVRVRYPEGVSTTFDATLELRGTTARSILSGTATVLRYSMSPNVDFASMVARPTQPMIASGTQNELLRGMQLDVKVDTSRNARLESSLTRDIQAEASLTLRGTPFKPILLGRVVINQGEINFLGNRYRVSRGEISFVNPAKLEPILDLDLSTRVRGIDVTITFTGPPDRLNATYRSDPPLQANEIIPLLAVGRAPTSDPALLARRNERDQSWEQIGASNVMGTVLDSLEGGRLQRFFGVSRIKIDPKLTGVGNSPEAQLTIEQQLSKDLTFTYVSSFAQEQQQLFRLEWNVSRQWSVLAVRDENGLFGVEFQFKKQFKSEKREPEAVDWAAERSGMVERQIQARGIRDARVLDAMRRIPREQFIPEENRHLSYADDPVQIGFGQTISQPYMTALMCECLELKGAESVLEVGAGCGYHAAVLARWRRGSSLWKSCRSWPWRRRATWRRRGSGRTSLWCVRMVR